MKNTQLDRPTPETDAFAAHMSEEFIDPSWLEFSQELERERDEAREESRWFAFFLEHIRDNADIRYGKKRGLLAFSDLRDEASRKWKGAAK